VLDYGCGTGRTTLDLLSHGHHVTAFDISLKMLGRAREKVQKLGLAAEFATDPAQLCGQTWPVITCIGVLDYYPDPLQVLRDLIQYLDDHGVLIVTFPNALSPLAWLYALGSHWTIPVTLRTPRSACQIAQRAGFRVEKLIFAFPSFPPLGHTLIMRLSPL
jgi:2-polyprenyl-3-methyl-5-hydroxy-6-metoxy-1,4-benzoquinol methylase